ncbi:MAG: hypothetical protein ACR2LZ_10680 [Pyrinomonadaceae bacterium]
MALDDDARHRDAMEKASKLAPPEEITGSVVGNGAGNNNRGAIVVDTGALKLPENLLSSEEKKSMWSRPEPVVIFIMCAALLFIAFIAWLIMGMPPAK